MSIIKVKGLGAENLGRRNLVINGGMQIAQRTVSATQAGAGTYNTIDRWKFWDSSTGTYTSEQSHDAPAGFGYSLLLKCTGADTSIAAGEYVNFEQKIEALNLQHLSYGSNDAKTITLSFYCKSNKTGQYGIYLAKPDNALFHFFKTYTINSANTWERKFITIPADSNIKGATGVIDGNSDVGLHIYWNLAMGSTYHNGVNHDGTGWTAGASQNLSTPSQVNWMDNIANNFYLTGVQLEVGDAATDFEHRSFAEELSLCQRYYFKGNFAHSAYATTSVYAEQMCYYPVAMRGNPDIAISGGTSSNIGGTTVRYDNTGGFTGFAHSVGPSSNGMCYVGGAGSPATLIANAEL